MSHNFVSFNGNAASGSGVISTDYSVLSGDAYIYPSYNYLIPSNANTPQLRLPDSGSSQGSWIKIVNTDSDSFTVYIRRLQGGMIYHPDGTTAPLWGSAVINQYNGITFDGRGTVHLYCQTADQWYAYFTPSVEMSLNTIGDGGIIQYSSLTKQFNASGVVRSSKIITANVSETDFIPYTGYETSLTEEDDLTITFPDNTDDRDLTQSLEDTDFFIDNKGTANITLNITTPYSFDGTNGYYTYFRTRWTANSGHVGDISQNGNGEITISPDTKVKVCVYEQGGNFTYYRVGVVGKVTSTVTGNHTVNFGYEDEQVILVNNGANNVTITLADTATQTWAEDVPVTIKRLGSGSVTVQCSGSDVIDGTSDTSFTVANQYDAVRLTAVASTGYYKI